jgi:ADP-dependent NAD(P)H-hydrate dehydratase / NAD(P)H-hydrate epimerase
MFAVVGTIPDDDFPLFAGPIDIAGNGMRAGGKHVDINRGTPALLAAASMACEFFGADPPHAYLIGDNGRGHGSRKLYAHLETTLPACRYTSLTFHYIQPDVDWHNRVLFAVEEMAARPILIADAGFMYAAKMSGQAPAYDIFTPDIGELAFLADETAPHPFYTRGFIFHESHKARELIARAYQYGNAAQFLAVKGETDLVADQTGILETIDAPTIPALEAIGGTGDILTGLVAALTGLGQDIRRSCVLTARISRLAGQMADPDPGTQIFDIIKQIPEAIKTVIDNK